MTTSGAKSTNPFDDDSDDDSYDDDEMERALEAMDIDADFDCWTSFRASVSIKKSPAGSSGASHPPSSPLAGSIPEDPPLSGQSRSLELTQSEINDCDKWSRRVKREEVYSQFYKPVPRESREIHDLANFFGISKEGGGSSKLLDKLHLKEEVGQSCNRAPISKLLFPTKDEPHSILLKRGPILLRRGDIGGERELILLSHGFIVATTIDPQAAPPAPAAEGGLPLPKVPRFVKKIPSGLKAKLIRRNFETAEELTSVVAVEDVDLVQKCTEDEENSFAVVVEDGDGGKRRYVFTCAKPRQKEAWLEALAVSVVQVNMHTSGEGRLNRQVGWQHDILRTSIYSAAARGDGAMVRRLLSKKDVAGRTRVRIDALDSYGGYTALHYAAMRNQLSSMEALLQAGANVAAMDKDMREPIFYAERFKHGKAVHLLESYGASRSPPMADELFSGANITTRSANSPQNTKLKFHDVAKAKGVAGAMAENMAAMRERGERLDKLENKTAQLERNAVDYRDTARQLKEKAKKQNTGMFGF